MAKGKCWAKDEADRWVERWWDSGLTSDQFVLVEGLPISARSLRAHERRRFREVLTEWKAQRSSTGKMRNQVANSAELGAPDQSQIHPLDVGQVARWATQSLRGGFDFSNVPSHVASPCAAAGDANPFGGTRTK